MNLKSIKEVVNSESLSDAQKINSILQIFSEDKDFLLEVLKVIQIERDFNKELITECNFQLSRADIGLEKPMLNEDNFINNEIKSFYMNYEGFVGHCFKDYGKRNS